MAKSELTEYWVCCTPEFVISDLPCSKKNTPEDYTCKQCGHLQCDDCKEVPEKKRENLEAARQESMELNLTKSHSWKLEPSGLESMRSTSRRHNPNRPSPMMPESRKLGMRPDIKRSYLSGRDVGGYGRPELRRRYSRQPDSRPPEPMKSESRRPILSRPAPTRPGNLGRELKQPELKQTELKKSISNIQPKQEEEAKNIGHTSAGKKVFRSRFREEL